MNTQDFILSKDQTKIYKTKPGVSLKCSFLKSFENGVIENHHLKNIIMLGAEHDKVSCHPFLILGEPIPCKFSDEIMESVKDKDISNILNIKAVPVCFYYENLHGWFYVTDSEWESKIEETKEEFIMPKIGGLYKFARKNLKSELGEDYPANIMLPSDVTLFHSEKDLRLRYDNDKGKPLKDYRFSDSEKPVFTTVKGWDFEFMFLNFSKPFLCTNSDIDQLKTSLRGGVIIQPTQIIAVDREAMGWFPLTLSRARYAMELIKEG